MNHKNQDSFPHISSNNIPIPDELACSILLEELQTKIAQVCYDFVDKENAEFIAEKISLADSMGVSSHGLHYFLHSLLPHLIDHNINNPPIKVVGNTVISIGTGGVGFFHLQNCLLSASEIAKDCGISLVVMRMPGKIGALRVYCQHFMDRKQLILMLKNTAPSVGIPEIKKPVFGTNPICIGIPETNFIYDACMSTVATNKLRLAMKTKQNFQSMIGFNTEFQPTNDPHDTLEAGGYLSPFSFGPYWYKSFFLGIAIEVIAALAGGKTGDRVGNSTGTRLHSEEGMIAVIIDKSSFPNYEESVIEVHKYLHELQVLGLEIPGSNNNDIKKVNVFIDDWRKLISL